MIIIPARLASTRFENKILCDIGGLPMFVKTAKNASLCDEVVVACDDENVMKIANKHDIKAVITAINHQSGSDRINEACEILGLKDDEIVVNVQADEPFFERENLLNFLEFSKKAIKDGAFMTSCYKLIDFESANEPNIVKVVLDSAFNALYFSRSIIPYARDEKERVGRSYFGHIGIYGFSAKSLREFCLLKDHALENTEKLEQLRALSASKKIAMLQIATNSVGIDTKDDYLKASKLYNFKAVI